MGKSDTRPRNELRRYEKLGSKEATYNIYIYVVWGEGRGGHIGAGISIAAPPPQYAVSRARRA